MEDEQIKELVAARLHELREREYPTAARFAEAIGVDASALSRMESGQQRISTLVLRRAAEVLDVPMDDFFRPARQELVRLRAGEGGRPGVEEMLRWAQDLHRDLGVVRAAGRERRR